MGALSDATGALLRMGRHWSRAKGVALQGVFLVLFVGAVGTLLWKTHAANQQREALALEQFRLDSENLASNLEYFFQERHNDLRNLSESRQVETYFENVALGMSPRYGLLASLQEVENLFARLLEDKRIGQAPIFECVALADAFGNVLIRLDPGARARGARAETPAPPEAWTDGTRWRLLDREGSRPDLALTRAVAFQGRTVGTVSVRMSMDVLLKVLSRDRGTEKQRSNCLVFERETLLCPGSRPRAFPDALKGQDLSVARIPSGMHAGTGVDLAVAAPVEGAPFTVLSLAPERALLGSPTWPLTVAVGLLSLVLLAGLALLGRANAERMVLNARVEEQTRLQRDMQKRVEEFNTLFEALPGYAFYKDAAGVYVSANAAFCDAVGLPLDQLPGKRDTDIFPDHLARGYMRDDQLVLSGLRDFFETEEVVLHKGREIQLITRKLALRHSDGSVGGLIGLGFDLTEKKRIEQELRLANERMEERIRQRTEELAATNAQLQGEVSERLRANRDLNLILDSISVILIVVDGAGRVLRWNKAAHHTFDIAPEPATGRAFESLPLPWDWDAVSLGIQNCLEAGQSAKLNNVWYERQDGADGFLVVTVSPLGGNGRGVSGYLVLCDDITDVRFLEAQLSQAAKLEAIGQLAAGIAHEINTPTQYVGDSVTFLKDAFTDLGRLLSRAEALRDDPGDCGPDAAASLGALLEELDAEFLKEEVPRTIARIFDGIERISSIVLAMKRFSYTSGDDKKAVDIRNAIENTLVISRNEWKYVAEAETDFDPELTDVVCLAGDINQVLLNIIINAAHAIGDVVKGGQELGRIAISTKKDGDWAEIRIRDTGTGIPESVGNKVFNLFFTTKEVGKGTGQGLAIAHDIVVNKHGGSITYESEPGRGTTFIIRLPVNG